jgi:serine/threonine protein kinase
VVFLGHDKETNQDVAIKVEKEENEDVRSLEREVQVLKKLADCDGVPKYLWSGEEQDYNILVISLLGKDLAFHMKNLKKFSIKTVLSLGIQICTVLEMIHIRGIIHRDLKPENIMLGKDQENGKVFLVDFGISKIYRDSNNKHM